MKNNSALDIIIKLFERNYDFFFFEKLSRTNVFMILFYTFTSPIFFAEIYS